MIAVEVDLVPKQQHEGLVHVRLEDEQRAREPKVDVRIFDVSKVQAERGPVTIVRADLVPEISDDHVHRADGERVAQELEMAGQERFAIDLEQDLRNVAAPRVDALALPAAAMTPIRERSRDSATA